MSESPQSGISDNAAGAISYLTFVPAIVFLVLAPYNANPYVRLHAWQSIFLNVAAFVTYVAISIVLVLASMTIRISGFFMSSGIVIFGTLVFWAQVFGWFLSMGLVRGECSKWQAPQAPGYWHLRREVGQQVGSQLLASAIFYRASGWGCLLLPLSSLLAGPLPDFRRGKGRSLILVFVFLRF